MLLVLALIWGAFLVWWLRSRAEGTFGDSVGTFRRHLHVLERTAPVTVRPANRLRGPQMVPAYRPPAGIQGPPARVNASQGLRAPMSGTTMRRRQTLKRRRDVLFVLAVAVLATLVMAAATRSHTIIYLQVLCDAALVGYVAMLVHMRNLAAERDIKLAYLPRERNARPVPAFADTGDYPAVGAAARRAPARRRPTPSYAYGAAGGYGELAMRRAVN